MTHEILTPFEKKILDEVIRPALSNSYESHYYGQATYAQNLNFVKLVRNVRVFYQKNCGQNWNKVCIESEKPEEYQELHGSSQLKHSEKG